MVDEGDYADDPSIDRDSVLWRRIPPKWIVLDNTKGIFRLSSAAFQNQKGYDAFSVDIAAETSVERTLDNHDNYSLVSFTAGLARELGQGVMRKPEPNNPAHAHVFGKKTGSVKNRFRDRCEWVVRPT